MNKLFFWSPVLLVSVFACATAEVEGDGAGAGGTSSGGATGTGGSSSTGGGTASGGSTSGGSTGSGSTGNLGGDTGTGGATGGTGGGTGGTGGVVLTGDCADKPTFTAWAASSPATSLDVQVVHACTSGNPTCTTAAEQNVVWLWQCTQSHPGNCISQAPGDTNSWAAVKDCTDEGMGGAEN